MKFLLSSWKFFLAAACVHFLTINAMGNDFGSQIKSEIKILASNADVQTRADRAENLCSTCKKAVQAGQKGAVVAVLPQLIGLLDDKNSYIVFWVAKVIGRLGNDGRSALPKLEQLSAKRVPGWESKNFLDAVDAAIKQIRGAEGEKQSP